MQTDAPVIYIKTKQARLSTCTKARLKNIDPIFCEILKGSLYSLVLHSKTRMCSFVFTKSRTYKHI